MFRGPSAIEVFRGESNWLVGAIVMPVLVGPGTIGTSTVIRRRHDPLTACAGIVVATVISNVIMGLLKSVHDSVRPHNESPVARYIETTGRITALSSGSVSVETIMNGIRTWALPF